MSHNWLISSIEKQTFISQSLNCCGLYSIYDASLINNSDFSSCINKEPCLKKMVDAAYSTILFYSIFMVFLFCLVFVILLKLFSGTLINLYCPKERRNNYSRISSEEELSEFNNSY